MPSPLSVTGPIVPWPGPSGAKVTVPPEEVRGLPFASLSTTVKVVVLVPSAVSVGEAALTTLWATVAGPGCSEMVVGVAKSVPLSRGVIVTGPAAVPAV